MSSAKGVDDVPLIHASEIKKREVALRSTLLDELKKDIAAFLAQQSALPATYACKGSLSTDRINAVEGWLNGKGFTARYASDVCDDHYDTWTEHKLVITYL